LIDAEAVLTILDGSFGNFSLMMQISWPKQQPAMQLKLISCYIAHLIVLI